MIFFTCGDENDMRISFKSVNSIKLSVNGSIYFGNLGNSLQFCGELGPLLVQRFGCVSLGEGGRGGDLNKYMWCEQRERGPAGAGPETEANWKVRSIH